MSSAHMATDTSQAASGSSDANPNLPVVCGVIVKQEAAESTDFNPCDVSRLNALQDDVSDQDRDIGGEFVDNPSLSVNEPSTTRTGQVYSPHGIRVKTEIKDEDEDNDVKPTCSKLDMSPGKRENSGDVENPSSPKMSRTTTPSQDQSSDVTSTSSRDDSNRECSVCLQPFCHPIKLPCGHIFCYLCAKGFANQHGRCAFCRAVIPPGYMNIPELMNDLSVQDSRTIDTKYTWFYEGRNEWWQFEERLSDELEQQYTQSLTQYDLLISGFLYTIDFQAMIQFRKDRPQRIRRIKRDILTAPSKGIAGIRNDLMQGRVV